MYEHDDEHIKTDTEILIAFFRFLAIFFVSIGLIFGLIILSSCASRKHTPCPAYGQTNTPKENGKQSNRIV